MTSTVAHDVGATRAARSAARRHPLTRIGGWYIAPAWVLILLVIIVPVVVSVWLSFRNETLSAVDSKFVGVDNYRTVLGSADLFSAIRVTAVISIATLLLQLPVGFLLAVVLHKELRGTRFFRSALLMPMLLTPVAVGLMWRFMLNADAGVVNGLLGVIDVAPVNWLGDRTMALFCVVLVDSWQNIPFVMLLLLAGLQSLPSGPLEAAEVDGASTVQRYRFVVLPLLAPVALVVVMIRIIESIKLFDIIYILTQGGPGTATQNLSMLDYRYGFSFLNTSQAAALGVMMCVLLVPIYRLWVKATR